MKNNDGKSKGSRYQNCVVYKVEMLHGWHFFSSVKRSRNDQKSTTFSLIFISKIFLDNLKIRLFQSEAISRLFTLQHWYNNSPQKTEECSWKSKCLYSLHSSMNDCKIVVNKNTLFSQIIRLHAISVKLSINKLQHDWPTSQWINLISLTVDSSQWENPSFTS